MATVCVNEFNATHPITGEPIWPPARSTDVTVPGSMTIAPGTVYAAISSDADCRIGVGQAAQAYSPPLLSAIANPFRFGGSAPVTLNFL